jgi:PelA/Pel-15E family pectate lyase
MSVCRRPARTFLAIVAVALLSAPAPAAAQPARAWPPDQFLPVTAERIAALPAAEQQEWRAYLAASLALAGRQAAPTVPDYSPLQPLSTAPRGGVYSKGLIPDAPADWYATDAARAAADRIVTWQTPAGGWVKGGDYSREQAPADRAKLDVWSAGTFDNNSTTTELRLLARVIAGTRDTARSGPWRGAFLRGLGYVFAAQYPNGGFPQIYPLAGGYHDAVTFNDNAMVHVLEVLRDVAAGQLGAGFVSAGLRREAGVRYDRGLRCLLAAQVVDHAGRKTVWGQQHDALTLKPSAARNYEPIAECAQESAYLAVFLMSLRNPPADVSAAVEGAIAWFRRAALRDLAWVREPGSLRGEAVPTPGAPPLWARFYELGTLTPIFGDRDRTIHYAVGEISAERRSGYGWYGTWPAAALEAYASWQTRGRDSQAHAGRRSSMQ